jgi:hypothetical protein
MLLNSIALALAALCFSHYQIAANGSPVHVVRFPFSRVPPTGQTNDFHQADRSLSLSVDGRNCGGIGRPSCDRSTEKRTAVSIFTPNFPSWSAN